MNETISTIRKISGQEYILGMMAFCALVGPGFLVIYQYHPELIKDLDFGKLLLFSTSLNAPVVFAATILSGLRNKQRTKKDALISGTLSSCVALHIALLVAYIYHLTFREFLVPVAVVIALFALVKDEDEGGKPSKAEKQQHSVGPR